MLIDKEVKPQILYLSLQLSSEWTEVHIAAYASINFK